MRFVVMLVLGAVFVGCSGSGGVGTSDQLADAFVASVNDKDGDRLAGLIHPGCLTDLTSLEQKFLDEQLERNFSRTIPEGHSATVAGLKGDELPFGDAMRWPIRPTHQIAIEFNTDEHSSVSIIRFLREQDGEWSMVVCFPNDENMKLYEEKLRARQNASPSEEEVASR